MTGRRFVVIGTSGSGKTVMAARIAGRLGLSHVELDAFQHEPGWVQASDEDFRARVAAATAGDDWVVDGNYSNSRDLTWPRATAIVWLDYTRAVVMRRVLSRSLVRGLGRRELWNGNREDPRNWLRADHPIRWAWSTHAKRRAEYSALVDHRWVHLRHPAEARAWLSTVGTTAAGRGRARR